MPIVCLRDQVYQAVADGLAVVMPDETLTLDVQVGLRPAICPDCETMHVIEMVDVIVSLDCCETHRLDDITFADYENVVDQIDGFAKAVIEDAVSNLNLQRMEAHEGDTAAEPDELAPTPPGEAQEG